MEVTDSNKQFYLLKYRLIMAVDSFIGPAPDELALVWQKKGFALRLLKYSDIPTCNA